MPMHAFILRFATVCVCVCPYVYDRCRSCIYYGFMGGDDGEGGVDNVAKIHVHSTDLLVGANCCDMMMNGSRRAF
jgi:hypothetical protein